MLVQAEEVPLEFSRFLWVILRHQILSLVSWLFLWSLFNIGSSARTPVCQQGLLEKNCLPEFPRAGSSVGWRGLSYKWRWRVSTIICDRDLSCSTSFFREVEKSFLNKCSPVDGSQSLLYLTNDLLTTWRIESCRVLASNVVTFPNYLQYIIVVPLCTMSFVIKSAHRQVKGPY